MSVRKRAWTTRKGEAKEAWIVDYVDGQGERHIQTFKQKKQADAYWQEVGVAVRAGTHTPVSKSITVSTAVEDWLTHVEQEERERSTLLGYRTHAHHINAAVGKVKLANLTTPRINSFRDELLASSLSRSTARKVLTSLKSCLKEAQRRGNVAQNVALPVMIGMSSRTEKRLEVGVDIPSRDEIKRILDAANRGRRRPLMVTAIFTGLRASELRGLTWDAVDLDGAKLTVRQRANFDCTLGPPKSKAGTRTVPLPPMVVNTLRQWREVCPASP